MKNVRTGKVNRDRRGRKGVAMEVESRSGGVFGRMKFASHGITAEQAAEKIRRAELQLEMRAQRLQGFKGSWREIEGDVKITDCRILVTGESVQLDVVAKREGQRVARIRRRYDNVADVPSNEEIAEEILAIVAKSEADEDSSDEWLARVSELAGRA